MQNNPTEFDDAYWQVNSLKVYSAAGVKARNSVLEGSSQAVAVKEEVKVAGGVNVTEVAVSSAQTLSDDGEGEQAPAAPVVAEEVKRSLHRHLVRHQHHKHH